MGIILPSGSEADDVARQDALRLALAHRPLLIGLIYAMVRDFTLSEKLFQDLCVTICDRWPTEASPIDHFPVWSTQLARNRVQATLRVWNEMGRTSLRLPPAPLIDALEVAIAAHTRQERMQFDRAKQALRACLMTLPRHLRDLLELCYVNHLSTKAIASKLGLESDSVSRQLMDARHELMQCMQKRMAQPEGQA
jgi:RNA polymerase sigma factor (sigma-70 family)